ncbi:UNVERIFIED_CONTAM: Polyol transporter 5 [Sesamum radiatum]|uniref:Polyol transporter 5 n=1 Tax=Sesamum radiatum TaxID=300843 RepID=A0AAW2JGA0_SESRA
MAIHARNRHDPFGDPHPRHPRHARVASVARHAGPTRRSQTSPRKNLRLIGGSQLKTLRYQTSRRNTRTLQRRHRFHSQRPPWERRVARTLPVVLHIMLCAFGMHFFQMMTGIETVILYSPEIFEKAGIKNNTHKLLGTMAIGFVKTLSILVAMFLSDRIGRRPLLLTSVGGCCVCLMGLGTGLTFIQNSDHRLVWAMALCVGSILCYVSIFAIGMGPVTWVYSSEIFPLRLRAQGCGLAVAVNRVTSAACTMTFISLYKAITIGGALFLYAGFAAIAWVFFYTLFPETRGKTLEEIEALFGTFFKWRSTMRALNENKGEVQTGNTTTGAGNI